MLNVASGRRPTMWILLICVIGPMASPPVGAADTDVLASAWEAIDAGRLSTAEELLGAQLADRAGPATSDCAIALEIIRRIRLEYSLTPQRMLARLKEYIPDVTADDVERWRASDDLQHRVLDGKVRYFKRAASTLFRFCPAAAARRVSTVGPAGLRFDLTNHVARLVAQSEQSETPLIHPVKHHVRYELCVKAGHPRLHAGAKVRCWLPMPQVYRQQGDVRLLSTDPPGGVVAPEGTPQRTVYFEQVIDDASVAPKFVAEFEFVTSAYVPKLDAAVAKPYDVESELYRRYTAQRPPHIVFFPELVEQAQAIVGAESNPLVKARLLFNWVDANIPWCSEMEYSTIRCLPAKALAARRGDCGVQGMLFITLCRAVGIPARWQSGWETLPGRANMHDWAEFYVEPWGWLPADASYGVQDSDDQHVREFYCGHMDAYRMIVNLDYGRELYPPKTSFRSEPADFQRGEIEIDGHNLYFDEWSWNFDVQTTPLDGGLACLDETFDALVGGLLRTGDIPGAVIAVGRKTGDGYETWCKAYGFMQTQPKRVPMCVDAVFDLASMTKPIATGTSLMILADEGRLSLDDRLGKYLKEFDSGNKQAATIHQLMTHMTGMKPYVGGRGQRAIKEQAGFPCAAAIRAHVRGLELQRPPGEVVIYSCLNAILGAEIVESVSGRTLDQFAADRIFKPLGMADSGFNPPERLWSRCVPTTAAPGRGRGAGEFLQGQVHDPLAAMQEGVSGNAGLFSTAADLGRFAQMMLNGGELDGTRVLKEQTVAAMTRIQNAGAVNAKGKPDRRGLLWDLYVPDPGDVGVDRVFAYGHTGYTGTAIRFYPEHGVYVIALTNRVHPDDSGRVGEFRRRVWDAVGRELLGVAE